MKIDMHYHLSREADTIPAGAAPLGCIISRHPTENERCFRFATRKHRAVALFADPSLQDWQRTLFLVKKRKALSYNHFENVGAASISFFDPIFLASEEQGIPVIVHLSRHDDERLARAEASKFLNRICTRFPRLQVIVAHLGGENFWTVLEYAAASESILLDTSCFQETADRAELPCVDSMFRWMSAAISSRQILFGSDHTLSKDTQSTVDSHSFRRVFSEPELEDIFQNNGNRILRQMTLV